MPECRPGMEESITQNLQNCAPNGLEMPATPTNRGWINRVAAVSRQFGAKLGELTKETKDYPLHRSVIPLGFCDGHCQAE